MPSLGDVEITFADGGSAAALVPGPSVALVIGCSSLGTVAAPVATQNPNTLVSTFGWGPLVEAAAMICQAGGTAIAMRATSNAAGSQGAVQLTRAASSTSVVTTTGAALDDYYVQFQVLTGGTIGAAGIVFKLSLDAGRNFGPPLTLGTANTYVIPNTGVTLAFGAGTLDAGDIARIKTTSPAWNDAGVQACLTAFQSSQYAVAGVGVILVVGPAAGADASTFSTYLETLATQHIYNGALINARDALGPAAWTGSSAEAESTWITSLGTDYSAVSARRIDASAGYYNVPSAFANPVAGSPRYRRPLSWMHAARRVRIPPQRLDGRVKDGSIAELVVDPTNDPQDGFVYHDERVNPGLDAARFTSARTRIGLPGFYFVMPNMMSPPGSQVTFLPHRNVLDIAADIVHQTGQQEIDDDVRLNPNGTINNTDATRVEDAIEGQLKAQMVAASMISGATVTIDRTTNLRDTNEVDVVVSINRKGYILTMKVTLGFQLAGQGG
jgi:hypothetical protein